MELFNSRSHKRLVGVSMAEAPWIIDKPEHPDALQAETAKPYIELELRLAQYFEEMLSK